MYENTVLQAMTVGRPRGSKIAHKQIPLSVILGVLNYDEKVSKYWPEFAQNGKDEIRVCDVLRHEAGLTHLARSIEPEQLSRQSIKKNEIGKIIEESKLSFPSEFKTKRAYHAMTRY